MGDQQLHILQSTPGWITISIGQKSMRVGCERFIRGHGSPDFVIYKGTIEKWDPPFETEVIDGAARERIVDELTRVMRTEKQWSVEVE